MPKHFSDSERVEIRKRLLISAKKLFIHYGFNKTTIQDITKKASIGKGSFYSFYNSKGDIFLEIYQIEREKIKNDIYLMHDENNNRDISNKLYSLLKSLVTILQTNEILRLMYEPGTLDAIMDKSVEKRLAEHNRQTNQTLLAVVDSWLGRKTEDHEVEIIVGMLRAITMLRHHITAIGVEIYEEVVETMINYVVEGITKKLKKTDKK